MNHYQKNRESCLRSKRKFYIKNKVRLTKYKLERKHKLRAIAIEGLGGKCACCGLGEYEFLTIGHVNGNGSAHRSKRNQNGVYIDVIRSNFDTTKYEAQCFNCNCGANINGGVCPHKIYGVNLIACIPADDLLQSRD